MRDSREGAPVSTAGPSVNSTSAAPVISLPKGGGAIRGISEKFAANPVTGTGSLSVPIATSPGRSGFGPQLSLTYDSGSGNGPFGFGWNLPLPSITRKTEKGLPKYQDGDESDTFILSGAEDLVPVLKQQGNDWVPEDVPDRTIDTDTYWIRCYRPRIEGLFARIERWTNTQTNETHWRSISKDNVVTVYGRTTDSRIEDPEAPDAFPRIFSWLICESYDDKGNAIYYEYEPEDSAGIDLSQTNERNRTDKSRSANRYLKRIKYGNKAPVKYDSDLPREFREDLSERTDWLFEVVFDYDEGHYEALPADPNAHQLVNAHKDPTQDWQRRQDPFSSFRSGFEVRTYRLCRRALMFHHFKDELGVEDYLVRSTGFKYKEGPIASFITGVTQSGYKHQNDGTYLIKPLPPLEFEYSKAAIQDKVHDVHEESLENLPQGLDGAQYQWVDIDGEGASGILTEQGNAWAYKRNVSALPVIEKDNKPQVVARFASTERLAKIPSFTNLSEGRQQLLDLGGDGQLDVVEFDSPTPGFYERTKDEAWHTFKPFVSLPNISWQDPNLKFVDLTGDGHADIFVTEDEAFTWYQSLAEIGFASGEKVSQALDEERGPKLVFADGTQSICLADISGDGLTDLVRIRNGEVCYWPNLGYGRFGAKVTMDNSPHFDAPDQFDQRRIRLADIDGSGVTDIIYLKNEGVYIYLNESGNRWADAEKLRLFPQIDNLSSVIAVDLLGNGTACLVWSSPLPDDSRQPMRYIDLMGGQKPHLLTKVVNNLGAETHIHYVPSTKFYLADKRAGKPWITRLPFPVHVVERVETLDRLSRNRFVTRYVYHHGYFAGEEREFRGFGMVEQWDTEEFAALTGDGALPDATNIDAASHVPPVHTKTWFHTGVYLSRDHISDFFAGLLDANDTGEYYREPGLIDAQARALLLPDTVLPPGLTLDEERQACRSLKGAMLRQEVYALDGTPKAAFPYSVTEQDFSIHRLQPRDGNHHAVFFRHPRETITYHYERNPADPRIQHALTLEVDGFGKVLKQAAISYGRRQPDAALPQQTDSNKQTQMLITYTENRVTYAIDNVAAYPHDYRTPLPCETRTYELTGFKPENNAARFSFGEWTRNGFALPASAREIPYEQTADNVSKQKRLIEHVRTVYRKDNLTTFLPLGEVEPLALPGESYKLTFTPGLLTQIFRRDGQSLVPNPANVLEGQGANRGGYQNSQSLRNENLFPSDPTHRLWTESDEDDHWWIPDGRALLSLDSAHTAAQERAYAQSHFFLPHRYRDPFGQTTTVIYDGYDLLLLETRDALGNRVTVGERLSNGIIDPSKPGNNYRVLQPWRVMDLNRNRTHVRFDALGMVTATAVMGKEGENLGDLLEDIEADPLLESLQAIVADPLTHAATLLGKATTRIVYDRERYQRTGQPPFAATLARETHFHDPGGDDTKIQISFSYSDGLGREIQKKIQAEPEKINGVAGPPRWVGSGWTILNNKGKPVRQYEPFFSATHRFEFGVQVGVSPILFYDPVARVVATLHPNHTYEKVVFGPWQQTTWDVNDTVTFDPRTDNDVKGFLLNPDGTPRIPLTEYLPTWHGLRTDPSDATEFATRYPDANDRLNQKAAATKAAAHADTPTTAYFDTLGRPFLTVAHNKVVCPNHDLDGTEDKFQTRVELDIEGNQRAVRDAIEQNGDALGRIVMRYAYDMLGTSIHQWSMEAGARWMLNDVAGKPIRAWDSRGHSFCTEYDPKRRPLRSFVTGANPADPNQEVLTERLVYGEQHPEAELRNLRGALYLHLDQAGAVTTEALDFKGNSLRPSRRIATEYKQAINWSAVDAALPANATAPLVPAVLEAALVPLLESDTYTNDTTYDALNRPVTLTTPHTPAMQRSVIRPGYNEANMLERVDANLRGTTANGQPVWTPFVTNIDYDAKGQRQRIDYGNDVSTLYEYDPLTFRLVHLLTRRNAVAFPGDCPEPPPAGWPGCQVQNLHYTYDPVGNITHLRDDAQQTIYFKNKRVEPSAEYTYDAIYRLIEATGREHLGQGATPISHSHNDAGRVGLPTADATGRFSPNDGNAMGSYLERYVYDAVGNFLKMQHRGSDPAHAGWTRSYAYAETSLIEDGTGGTLLKTSNRLTNTTVGNGNPSTERYVHDAHGNMIRMPHLGGAHPTPNMFWDYRDRLRQTDLGGGGTAYYVYAAGQRVRKVWEKSANLIEERLYLGGFEIFRRHQGAERLERETLHIMDDKQRIAMVETRTLDTAGNDPAPAQLIRYQFGNHLGSAGLELDDLTQIISYEEYTPYGSSSYQAVRSQTETAKRYRFTGEERDEETGFNYHGARYYAPWVGRWAATDPAGLVDGDNLYRYSRDNPILFNDPNGMDPPPRTSRYSLGDFRLAVANPINDPLAHASYFDLAFPGLFGVASNALDLGNRTTNRVGTGLLNFAEFAATGLLFYGPTVLSHEWGGHVGAWGRLGISAEITSFSWFSGTAGPTGSTTGVTAEQDLAVSAAGVNQQALNAGATYNRVARFGYYTPQDAWAYFLGQAGTAAYALRTLTLASPPLKDDINAYSMGARTWSTEGIATAATLTALPALAGLVLSGYQFVFNNQRSIEVPSLQIGSARLSFPNLQTLLTSSGTVLGASSMLTLGGGGPSFLLGLDVRPTSDFALALSGRAYGLNIPGTRLQINPYVRFTAADPPGIFGGVELGLNVSPSLTVSGSIEGSVNDLRGETEGRIGGFRGGGAAILRF